MSRLNWIRTDVLHRVVRRGDGAQRDLEREEAAVRALAPLQVGVARDERARDRVRGSGCDPRAERGRRRDGRARELDADRAVAGHRVVRRGLVRVCRSGCMAR